MDLLDYFAGDWKLEKTIQGSSNANMIGTSQFYFTDQTRSIIKQVESVKVTLANRNNQSFNGSRQYFYKCKMINSQNLYSKYFADGPSVGELFYLLKTNNDFSNINQGFKCHGYHRCGCDDYVASYKFISDHCFELNYDIKGKNKDYKILSTYNRK